MYVLRHDVTISRLCRALIADRQAHHEVVCRPYRNCRYAIKSTLNSVPCKGKPKQGFCNISPTDLEPLLPCYCPVRFLDNH